MTKMEVEVMAFASAKCCKIAIALIEAEKANRSIPVRVHALP